ncbi:hypothetical protein [Sulfuricystis thermophila]|uniref:hypothetical protein n=1 Tax=Sulfuricystis thermophila TaxID=2496847 RepID=UPI00103645F1|nr:hypothetical protein [Sulfuricystis thermophila]
MIDNFFAKMSKPEIRKLILEQIEGRPLWQGLLEESSFRFDPFTEKAIEDCFRRIRALARNGELIRKNTPTASKGVVLQFRA